MSTQWMRVAARRTTHHPRQATGSDHARTLPPKDPLSPDHRRMLERDSGIDPAVIAARGYRTVSRQIEAKRLGFGDYQSRTPALVVPVFSLSGDVATYQLRPDIPRIKQGKVIKYETPSGSTMALDVSLLIADRVRDVSEPLFITEGVKKADSAISHDLCCIALLGVWNWRGKDGNGGKRLLADFERIPWNGRPVYLIFDSDLMEKEPVAQALIRLGNVLHHSFGASVRVVRLFDPVPGNTPTAAKIGLDDFLVRGGTRAQLIQAAEPLSSFEASRTADDAHAPYEATETGLVWHRPFQEGTAPVQLTNFTALITADIAIDDGIEASRQFELEAVLRGQTRRFTVSHERFQSMTWVIEHLGGSAIVFPGQILRDHARTAIQMLSGEIPEQRVYAHTGWREIDGTPVYLSMSGGIGPDGFVAGVEVRLPPALTGFALPEPPTGDALVTAIRASLALLDVVPDEVSAPAYAALWRSVLGSADFSIHFVGRTNAGKTACAALLQQHFGAGLDARHLPGSWSSTGNALEGLAFHVKDAILVVDDFAPHGTSNDVARMHKEADRVFRAAGNHSGRGRMRADGSLRAVRPPRGLIVSTGEDVPRGQSLRSRVFVLEIEPGATDWEQMTRCQADADRGRSALAMAGYVSSLARTPEWPSRFAERKAALREQIGIRSEIRRTLATTVELGAALSLFLDFAVESGALGQTEADALWERCWTAIRDAARQQGEHLAESEPTSQFGAYLAAAIASGRAHLTDGDGSIPANPGAWGWVPADEEGWSPRGERIGWRVASQVYLEPNAAFAVAQGMAQRHGDAIGLSPSQLWKRLAARSLLASRDTARRTNTIRRRLSGQSRNVLHVSSALFAGLPSAPNADKADNGDETDDEAHPHVGTDVGSRLASAAHADSDFERSSGPNGRDVGFVGNQTETEAIGSNQGADGSFKQAELSASGQQPAPKPTAEPTEHAGSQPDRVCYACTGTRFYPDRVCMTCHPRDWLTQTEGSL